MIDWGDGNVEVNAVNGKCIKCGKCCGLFIPVTKKEVSNIKKYVEEHNIKPENRIDGNNLELRCPFLDLKNHKCNIYPVRPFVCRDFICSRKDWKKHRDNYQLRADYNGIVGGKWISKGMYSMDELIYGDIVIHVRVLLEQAKDEKGNVTEENFNRLLKIVKREDILDKIIINGDDK